MESALEELVNLKSKKEYKKHRNQFLLFTDNKTDENNFAIFLKDLRARQNMASSSLWFIFSVLNRE